jgi:TrmH family RNA methyltransferase
LIEPVTSRQNRVFKRWRALAAGDDPSLVVVEGAHLLIEAAKARLRVVDVALDPNAPQAREWMSFAGGGDAPVTPMARALLSSLSTVESSPGILGVVERPPRRRAALRDADFVLILDGVQDPGNVGALLRSAEAAGVGDVWLLDGCADPLGAKALRASAGSAFRVPVLAGLGPQDAVGAARGAGLRLAALDARPGLPSLFDAPLALPLALVLGSEGRGLREELRRAADVVVRIPLRGPVESLNVAAAGAIALFEVARRAKLVG